MTALAWLAAVVHVAAVALVVLGVLALVVVPERVAAVAWLTIIVGLATRQWTLCILHQLPRGRA